MENKINNVEEKRILAKKIIELLENVNFRDWQKIKNIVDVRYITIQNESNFTCDKVTLNRINEWY